MRMHMRIHMVKVISLSNEAYTKLKSKKIGDKSFSEVVIELIDKEKRKSILDFAGAWKDVPEMDKIFKTILDERHKSKDRKLDLKW